MTTEFNRSLLRVALAQICQNLGWNSVHSTPMEILTDVLERYITSLGTYSHRYSEQFGRVEPTMDDLGLAFQEMGVNLSELSDFVKHVEPLPFAFDVPRFPIRRPLLLGFPKPNSRELLEREEHVHDHMPTMHPGWDEEIMVPTADGGDSMAVDGAEKRPAGASGDDEPAAKRHKSRVYPEDAAPSSYTMKRVYLSESGDICGQGKLPDSNAPPPPTPTATLMTSPLFKTPSVPDITLTESDTNANGISPNDVKVEVKSEFHNSPKSPRGVGRPPKSPKVGTMPETPKSVPGLGEKIKKKRGRPFKYSPGRPMIKSGKSPGRPPKSPGRPPKSPGRPPKSPFQASRSPGRPPKSPGRPPKSPGRPPKSPFHSPTRSPGRPPKSPGSKSPVKSPLSGTPLSPRSPGTAGRGRSPGRPPKSPGRVGRPPKSPGRVGRPPKSPGRPPLVKKEGGSRLPQSPVSQYLLTGELPIGKEGVPTKAQLKQQPIQSSPPSVKPSKAHKHSAEAAQQLDFTTPQPQPIAPRSPSDHDEPSGLSDTIDVVTTPERSPLKTSRDKLKKRGGSIDDTIAAVLKQTVDEQVKLEIETDTGRDSLGEAAQAQKEREDKLRRDLVGKDTAKLSHVVVKSEYLDVKKETSTDASGRITPDWIRQQAAEIDKLRAEDKLREVRDTTTLSPSHDFKRIDSPKEKIKSKKEKKKDREKKKHRDGEGDKADRQSKKERRLEEKLRERLRETSQSSSSPERAAPSGEKLEAIPSLRIGIGKQFTIKPMAEESEEKDKESKKMKKKKKKKEKEKERDLDEKEKKKKKDKDKIKKEADEDSVPKLKFKFGGQGKVFLTPTVSPRESPKRDIPKLVIKQRGDSPEKRVVSKKRSFSPSPSRSPSPPTPRIPTPPPPKVRSPIQLSPVRFTPSPELSTPKTPSMGSPFHMPSPVHSRSVSPTRPLSINDGSLSPAKTPSLAPSPPPSRLGLDGDVLPPPPPSSKGGNKRAVFAETQGTIIGENGEIIWICPACTLADDGSPMIGCDVCDDWYHWDCVGITQEPPEDESWYCPKHRTAEPPKKPSTRGRGRGRGRKKKL